MAGTSAPFRGVRSVGQLIGVLLGVIVEVVVSIDSSVAVNAGVIVTSAVNVAVGTSLVTSISCVGTAGEQAVKRIAKTTMMKDFVFIALHPIRQAGSHHS
jgi:hypothetical protein